MVKKGLNKHPGGKKKPQNLDHTQIKKHIQTETGVVVTSIDRDTKTVIVAKAADFSRVEAALGRNIGGWTLKQG